MRMGRHQRISYRIIGATWSPVVCLGRRKISAVVVPAVGNVAAVVAAAVIVVVVWPSLLLWWWMIGGGHTRWTVPYT